MNAQSASPAQTSAQRPAWIETVRRKATGSFYSDRICVDGLEVTLKSVDPSLVRWVLKYMQPLSSGSESSKNEECTLICLYEDELVAEASSYFAIEDNIDFLGRGKDGTTLRCAVISDEIVLYCCGSDGIFWLADFEAKTIFIVFSSRTKHPALDFSRTVRGIVASYLTGRGWSFYHAGAVDTAEGVLMIVGNPGAGKTSLILALVRDGARFVANEHLFIRADGGGIQALSYPLPIAVGLGTAMQFPDLAKLVETPDPLLYPRRRFSASRVAETPRDQWPSLDDKLQLLPEELNTYVGPSTVSPGGKLHAVVVPQVSKTPVTPKVEVLDEDASYDILADNLLEPSNNQSRFAWSRMVAQDQRGEGEDHDDEQLERLCSVNAVRLHYCLSGTDNTSGLQDLLMKSLPSKH